MQTHLTIKKFFNFRRGTPASESRKSRIYFTLESCTGSTIYNLTTGAFMAGFASMLGASDRYNGLLASIPLVAGMAQIFAPLILERLQRKKNVIIFFMGLNKLLISSVVFIPLLASNSELRLAMLFIFAIIAYTSLNVVFPGFTSWILSVVPENIRGKYFGIKDSYALTFMTVTTLTMGFVLDAFKKPGMRSPAYPGFVLVFLLAFVLALLNIFVMTKAHEPRVEQKAPGVNLLDCIVKPLSNKRYMRVVLFYMLWNIGQNLGVPYLAIYQVKYLQLDYRYIMFFNFISTVTMVITVRMWGKYADKTSWINSSILSIAVLSICHFLWGIISMKTLFLLPLAFVVGGMAWGGINISLFNLPFLFAPAENRTVYLGFNAAVGGISGLISTLAGGWIVGVMEGKSLDIGFMSFSNIQLIVLSSSLALLICSLYALLNLKGRVREADIYDK